MDWIINEEKMADDAVFSFIEEKRSCGEAVLKSGCNALSIQNNYLPDIALGLGGGVGLQGHVCGAVTGSTLVLSLAMAEKHPDYATRKKATLDISGRLCQEVQQKLGSVLCRDLCGLDLTSAEDFKKHIDEGKTKQCAGIVKEISSILARELILLGSNNETLANR